ncbi:MAG TPA: quinolinate synthase NadA, partial [Bacteroidales bacterium]|nr:quinolinate synthase NadA [Bacteroidales bacterium]
MNAAERIQELKTQRKAVILAHNYQSPEVQDVADYVGDFLGLSQKAASTDAEVIIFCGVDFMAESAKILSPGKKVILPESDAMCPMS